jgi:nickel/cobalt transporter (NicO) family protein
MIRAVAALAMLTAAPMAHPLGNFSINSYVGLTVHTDRVDAVAIVDTAEIPTLQDRPGVDSNGDGTVSAVERTSHAGRVCADLAAAVAASVDGDRLVWTVDRASFDYAPGAGGLDTSRLRCALTAPATVDTGAHLRIDNTYLADRVGWRELTAVGAGVGLDSPVPATSVSQELTNYPKDLLSSALNQRSADIAITAAGDRSAAVPLVSGGDPVSRWLAGLDRKFQDLAGGRLTVGIGLLAVLLAMVLGAGHAALPGHGKTILAAYLAGKRGRRRDAIAVAGTVTLTHTGGVLLLGLVLTAGTALAGERILGWLGLVSGVIVVAVGAGMLFGVLRHPHDHEEPHDHPHPHDHGPESDNIHSGHHDHGHDHGHDHAGTSRWGLAGIGLAGGLVPSPSALVVLLAAIGLGRTGYGVVLVLAYGAGMAATLTGAGLLLLAAQRRLARTPVAARLGRLAARLQTVTPGATAAMVLLVGAGLAVRAASGVL